MKMLIESDIVFNAQRDGIPGVPIAFVIDGEVANANAFSPPFANEYLLSSPEFSSEIIIENEEEFEVVKITTASSSVTVRVNDLFTAVLLSNPKIIVLDFKNDSHVVAGWQHDEQGFYVMNEETRIKGNGTNGN